MLCSAQVSRDREDWNHTAGRWHICHVARHYQRLCKAPPSGTAVRPLRLPWTPIPHSAAVEARINAEHEAPGRTGGQETETDHAQQSKLQLPCLPETQDQVRQGQSPAVSSAILRLTRAFQEHPNCGNCAKSNDQCVYSTNERLNSAIGDSSPEELRQGAKRRRESTYQRDGSSDFTSPSSNGTAGQDAADPPHPDASIETRLDRLTQLVEALSKNNGTAETTAKGASELGMRQERANGSQPPLSPDKDRNKDVDLLGPSHSSTRKRAAPTGSHPGGTEPTPDSAGFEFEIPSNASATGDPIANLNLGYLSIQDGGRTRYVGSTFWAYISDELDQLNTLLRDQNRYVAPNDIKNQACTEEDAEADSPMSETSDDDNQQGNSFHRSGDAKHNQKSHLRPDCEGCMRTAYDKSMLLQVADEHPARFRKAHADLLDGMPTERQSHILFRCWMSGVHGPNPIIYPPKALFYYERFWKWYNDDRESGKVIPDLHFLPMLYAIWYGGSVSISLRGLREWFTGITRASMSASFHDHITRCLIAADFPRVASIPALAAFLTMQMIAAREEEPLTSSLFVGLALRVAQMLGLHRDPTLFAFEPWEVETRRRLWWNIVSADILIAISSGLPPIVDEQYSDVKMVSEIKDMTLGTPEGIAYEEAVRSGKKPRDNPDEAYARTRPSMVSTHNMVLRARCILTSGARRMLKIHLGTKPMTRQDMEECRNILAETEHELNGIIRRIPTKGIPEMGFVPDRDLQGHSLVGDFDHSLAKPPTEEDLAPFLGMTPTENLYDSTVQYHWNTLVAFHKWARIVVSLWIDKMHCVAYVPFLKNARSKLWTSARQCALRHCAGFMRKFISLATDPAFQPFQWSWPGNHQPMHATMIMLVDLYERPHSVEAPRNRSLIDKMFSLAGPDGGIVSGEDGVTVQRPLREGGREAWDMLRRLRDKAWQKAGLDPDVLWTEDDQIHVGVAKPLSDADKLAQTLREDAVYTSDAARKPESAATSVPTTTLHPAVEGLHNSLNDPEWRQGINNPSWDVPANTPPFGRFQVPVRPPQEPAPFRFRPQKVPVTTMTFTAEPSSSVPPSTGVGDVPQVVYADNKPTAPMASTVPYFNPPTAGSSITQPSDPSTRTTPSPHVMPMPEIHDTSSPMYGQSSHLEPQQPMRHDSVGHFDWAQWDAVFGQHVAVDDFMMGVEYDSNGQHIDHHYPQGMHDNNG